MLKNPPKPTPAQLARIEELHRESNAALRRQEESWERSDTDGFLSQWANGMTASLNREKINLLRNGGYAQFPVLVHNGEVISTNIVTFPHPKFEWQTVQRWRLNDEAMHLAEGRRFIPVGKRSTIQRKFGFVEDTRWFPAVARIMGSGTGLSGCANAYVGVAKRDLR